MQLVGFPTGRGYKWIVSCFCKMLSSLQVAVQCLYWPVWKSEIPNPKNPQNQKIRFCHYSSNFYRCIDVSEKNFFYKIIALWVYPKMQFKTFFQSEYMAWQWDVICNAYFTKGEWLELPSAAAYFSLQNAKKISGNLFWNQVCFRFYL